MRIISGIIIGLLVFAGSFLIQQYVFLDKPDVVFSLSNEIYISLPVDGGQTALQQLLVRNTGRQPAEKVVVSISKPIQKYEIKKYSKVDSTLVVQTQSAFELVYPLLPPDGEIEITLYTTEGIGVQDLEVKHNSGTGEEIFEKSNGQGIFLLIVITIYLLLIGYQAQSTYKNWILGRAKYEPEKILKSKAPLWISRNSWEEVRKEAIGNYFDSDRSHKRLNDLKCWNMLNSERPKYVSDEEWRELVREAADTFKNVFFERSANAYYFDANDSVLSIDRPKHLAKEDWDKIEDFRNKYYLYASLTQRALMWDKDFEDALTKPKPHRISEDIDKQYKDKVREQYFAKIVGGLYVHANTDDFLNKNRLDWLTEFQRETILTMVKFLVEIRSKDEKVQQEYKNYKNLVEVSSQYLERLRDVIHGELKSQDRGLISDEDWTGLNQVNERIKCIINNEKTASEDSKRFGELRTRVEKQLELIDRVLNSPSYIDKFEDYGDTFSPGNLTNLKTVAALIEGRGIGNP